jgi:hypothetical protein
VKLEFFSVEKKVNHHENESTKNATWGPALAFKSSCSTKRTLVTVSAGEKIVKEAQVPPLSQGLA